MSSSDTDILMRLAAFVRVRLLSKVHDQLTQKELRSGFTFEGDDAIDYAFMGNDPNAADNQWLRVAYENRIPVIYFPGIAPGRYHAIDNGCSTPRTSFPTPTSREDSPLCPMDYRCRRSITQPSTPA